MASSWHQYSTYILRYIFFLYILKYKLWIWAKYFINDFIIKLLQSRQRINKLGCFFFKSRSTYNSLYWLLILKIMLKCILLLLTCLVETTSKTFLCKSAHYQKQPLYSRELLLKYCSISYTTKNHGQELFWIFLGKWESNFPFYLLNCNKHYGKCVSPV